MAARGRPRTLAKKRRKVLSETYRNLAIANFGQRAASMSAKIRTLAALAAKLFRIGFIPFTCGYLVTFACGSRGMFGARLRMTATGNERMAGRSIKWKTRSKSSDMKRTAADSLESAHRLQRPRGDDRLYGPQPVGLGRLP